MLFCCMAVCQCGPHFMCIDVILTPYIFLLIIWNSIKITFNKGRRHGTFSSHQGDVGGRDILARRSMRGRQGADESIHCPSFKLSAHMAVVTTPWLMTLSGGTACTAATKLPHLSRVCHALHHDRAWSIAGACALQVYTIRAGQRASPHRSLQAFGVLRVEVIDRLALYQPRSPARRPMRYTCKCVNFRQRIWSDMSKRDLVEKTTRQCSIPVNTEHSL